MSAHDRYLCEYHAMLLNRLAILDVETIAIANTTEHPSSDGPFVTTICEEYGHPVLASSLNECEYAADSADASRDCNHVYRWSVKDRYVHISTSVRVAIAARDNTAQDVPA